MQKAKKVMGMMVALGVLGLSSMFTAPVLAQQRAMDQLRQMTSGNEHTGVKFDGSPRDQRRSGIDTTVNASTSNAGGNRR